MKPLLALLVLAALLAGVFPAGAETAPPPAAPPSILDLGGMLHLVNNGNRVSKSYVPDDLVRPRVAVRKESLEANILMREAAARALERMFEAARYEAGHTLFAASGYRSFGVQQILFNEKVAETGSREKAMRRVAPAGASEHQLGLAMDVQSPSQLNLNPAFGNTPEGEWVAQNAHRFGFIIRYKAEWSGVTGIVSEPWHIRYVGTAHATAMRLLDIPLEIYTAHCRELPAYVVEGASHPLLAALVSSLIQGEKPESLGMLEAAGPDTREEALRTATEPYLSEGETYEAVLRYAYPTPRPTA
ncbi:MAG TPA: M15 family metallopeptidase, partial [Candidatus Limnocylindria bacterium]|nr:M15 family metallopeptidase [Candidatus Limnocylindria bacterium]